MLFSFHRVLENPEFLVIAAMSRLKYDFLVFEGESHGWCMKRLDLVVASNDSFLELESHTGDGSGAIAGIAWNTNSRKDRPFNVFVSFYAYHFLDRYYGH